MSEPIVRIRGLHKSFGHLEVVKGVDLDVQRGEVVVIFGRSGSGKSTLLRCVNMIEDPTSGTIEVSGVRLKFEAGKIVDASAERGEEFLIAQLDTDEGARTLGELGIGTNYGIDRGTREVLLDEKIGGTIHMAFGQAYPESGGTNESAVHTDLVCDLRLGGKLEVDGVVMQENGKFVV